MTNWERIKYLTAAAVFAIIVVVGTIYLFNAIEEAIPLIVTSLMGK